MGLLGRSRQCAFGTAGVTAVIEVIEVTAVAVETAAGVAVETAVEPMGIELAAQGSGAGNSGKPRSVAEGCRAQDRRRRVRGCR